MPTTTAERNRLARIDAIDAQIADLTAKRAALIDPPFQPGDRVTVTGEGPQVWTVADFNRLDPRLIHMSTDGRDRFNQPAGELTPVS